MITLAEATYNKKLFRMLINMCLCYFYVTSNLIHFFLFLIIVFLLSNAEGSFLNAETAI